MSELLRIEGPTLLVLVGPAGAGKTTWAREQFGEGQVVSSDHFRAQVGLGEWDQDASGDAFELVETILDMRLQRGLTTVVDTLGFDRKSRQRWADKARVAGMESVAVVFDTPADLCRERNRRRRDPVPARVLDGQIRRHREVVGELAGDGFDRVVSAPAAVAEGPLVSEATSTAAAVQHESPAAVRFGLVMSRFPWSDDEISARLRTAAQCAEETGFTSVWVMDHLRQIPQLGRAWEPLPEAYTTLAYLAGATERIRLGALVTNVTFRNLALLGKMIATLDVLSGGRAECGVGAGWFDQEATAWGYEWPSAGERLDQLEDALQLLPLLWGPGGKLFRGKTIEVPEAMNYPRPLQERIPILVGGGGERRTLRLVAEYADACNLRGSPEEVERKLEVLREHCRDVGRSFEEITVTVLMTALAAAGRTELKDLLEATRPPNVGQEEFGRAVNAGTTDDLVGHIRRYADVGVHEVMVGPPSLDPQVIRGFSGLIDAFSV